MTDDEVQKRIALQEAFRNRLKNLNITKSENYVSKLSPVAKPVQPVVEKVSKNEFKRRLNNFIAPLAKKMWAPEIQKKVSTSDKSANLTASKYFGNPWLYENEEWPMIFGQPATFVMQLNIETLPVEMAEKLGGKGLLQFFYQTDTSVGFDYCELEKLSLVRIVDITKPGKTLAQPKVKDFTIPKEKLIIGWKEYIDYPHYEDLQDNEDYKKLEVLAENNHIFLDEMSPSAYQGDKLGGYPFWTQAKEENEGYVYQIDAGCFFDGLKVPAHAPELFAGDGTGHIFIKEGETQGCFMWACT